MTEAPSIQHVHYDEQQPIIDREQMDMLSMEDDGIVDTSLVRELFDLFAEESASKVQNFDELCAKNDLHELRSLVHYIAGSAGNLGLARLASFYRGVERAIDEGELTDVTACEAPLRHEFECAQEAFRREFNF